VHREGGGGGGALEGKTTPAIFLKMGGRWCRPGGGERKEKEVLGGPVGRVLNVSWWSGIAFRILPRGGGSSIEGVPREGE